MAGASIIVDTIYQNGQPDGNRMIRKALSTMTTYVIPRPLLSEAKDMQGINRRGIYYLINEGEDKNITQIYIGQTRNGVARLDDHNRKKEFWNKAIMFLADNKTFTLDMISWLEEYAIKKAQESNRYEVMNAVLPKIDIDEFDRVNVEKVYEEIQFIMAAQGYKMNSAKEMSQEGVDILETSRNGIVAFGVYKGDSFEVLEGSQIDMSRKVTHDKYNKQREELIKSHKVVIEEGKYILKMTLKFKSPSGASDFVLGGSTNGWTEWKSKDGKTLDELYRRNTDE